MYFANERFAKSNNGGAGHWELPHKVDQQGRAKCLLLPTRARKMLIVTNKSEENACCYLS